MISFGSAIIIVLCILIIAFVVYISIYEPKWATLNYVKAKYTEPTWDIYKRSNGGYDTAAQLVLDRSRNISNPTITDHAIAATVIRRNIIDQEHISKLDENGNQSKEDKEETERRKTLFNEARDHFQNALQTPTAPTAPATPAPATAPARQTNVPPQHINRPTRLQAIGVANRHTMEMLPIGFIIDNAMDFAFGGLNELLINDPFVALNNPFMDFEPRVDFQLANTATRQREIIIDENKKVAKDVADKQGKKAAVDTYVMLSKQNTDDPQNTHDTSVLQCLKAIIERLRKDQEFITLPSLDVIGAELSKMKNNKQFKIDETLQVVDRLKRGERVVIIGATDEECLQRVWVRTNDPRNEKNKEDMRQAVFDALYDCWEDSGMMGRHIVCVNGRTSRILGSLALLDWDEQNWNVKKLEQFKNDIYELAGQVIKNTAEDQYKNGTSGMKLAAKSYVEDNSDVVIEEEPDPEDENKLMELMKSNIVKMIDDYVEKSNGAIPNYMIDTIKREAQAAVV